MPDEAQRAQQLRKEGASLLLEAWDDEAGLVRYSTEFGVFHDARGSLGYARELIAEGGADSIARAERILRAVASMQETREDDAHYGNFRWFFEDAGVTDLNAVEFALDQLNVIARDMQALTPDVQELVRTMIERGLEEIDRLDVHPSYTNIYLSDVCNSVLGGELLGSKHYAERGARRLREWFAFTDRSGAPHEFNSPTYLAVDIGRMASLAEHAADADVRLAARLAEERLWLHVAAHYHAGMAQLAGPHSRSYRDGWTGAPGYLKLMLWRVLGDDRLRASTPYYPRGREEGHSGIGEAILHAPPYGLAMLGDQRYPRETTETVDAAAGLDITTYMTESYALGSASRSYAVGEPLEPWPQWNSVLLHTRRSDAPGYGILFARYIVNDKGPGAVMHESVRDAEDHWEEGRHLAAQHRNRAIVAYGLQSRLRHATSNKLSVRMLGISDAGVLRVDGRSVRELPLQLAPGQPLAIDAGDAYVGIVPLAPTDMGAGAPIELRIQDGMLVLDIYNYRGPGKMFWEYRSLAGPFFKGNVRNAFVLEVAERSDYPSLDAFAAHVAEARIADSAADRMEREIVYACGCGALSMRYSLRDMSVVERRVDGAPLNPPMARSGPLDGSGVQYAVGRESLLQVPGARILGGAVPRWLVTGSQSGRYACGQASGGPAPLWLETPGAVVECDAFSFGRIALDAPGGLLEYEHETPAPSLSVRSDGPLRVMRNGRDVTSLLSPPNASGVREIPAG